MNKTIAGCSCSFVKYRSVKMLMGPGFQGKFCEKIMKFI